MLVKMDDSNVLVSSMLGRLYLLPLLLGTSIITSICGLFSVFSICENYVVNECGSVRKIFVSAFHYTSVIVFYIGTKVREIETDEFRKVLEHLTLEPPNFHTMPIIN